MRGTLVVIGFIGLVIFTTGAGCDGKTPKKPVDVQTTITVPAKRPGI